MNTWHKLSITEAASLLATDVEQGLSVNEAKKRLTQYGQNKLHKGNRFSALIIFVSQFKSLVIWVLIGAAAVSAALGETVDGIAIITIVILNAVIGFIQEYRAENAATVSDCGSELRLAVSDTPCFNDTNAVSDRADYAKSVHDVGRGWIYTADCPGTEKSHPPPPSKEELK